jgi:glucuronosyltransferase
VEGAKHGVILFSLGFTGFEPRDVPEGVVSSFMNAFASIDQRVIMRFDATLIPHVPKNVMIVDWFPQHDLLAHNATILFVSHCGMNGVLESIYHRVPILAMPIFADQPDNAARIVERGLGLKLDRHNLNTKLVMENIQEILNNHKYQDKVNMFADMWRDQRTTAFEDAIYWMELLLKYGNLDHLKINDADLNLFQYLCHDVILFFIFIILMSVFVTFKICRYMLVKISQIENDPRNRSFKVNNLNKLIKTE